MLCINQVHQSNSIPISQCNYAERYHCFPPYTFIQSLSHNTQQHWQPITMSGPTSLMSEKPTILFVHGAWDNGSAWDLVRNSLSKHGYPTVAPSLPSAGSRPPVPTHLEDANIIRHELQRLVHEQKKEVIAVGHSYGGFVVTESIRGFEKHNTEDGGVIHCLVMSAFVGCKGESVMSLLDYKMPEFLEIDVSILISIYGRYQLS